MNGKSYIGWCKAGRWDTKRWEKHLGDSKASSSLYFHRAIRKHGPGSFEGELLAIAETEKEIKEIEIQKISEYKSFGEGYNMTLGGEGTLGWKPTEENKKNISNSRKGQRLSEEHRKKISESIKGENHFFYGSTFSESHRKKISMSKKGKNTGKENPFFGKSHSEAQKEKWSKERQGMKGSVLTEEHKKKLSDRMKKENPSFGGLSEEHKKKIAKSMRDFRKNERRMKEGK